MKNLLAKAIKIANQLDHVGAKTEADVVDHLVVALSQKAEELAPNAKGLDPKKLLDLVSRIRSRAEKEIQYGKSHPQEAPEENQEAAEMNKWADELVAMFGLKEEKPEPAGEEEISESPEA